MIDHEKEPMHSSRIPYNFVIFLTVCDMEVIIALVVTLIAVSVILFARQGKVVGGDGRRC